MSSLCMERCLFITMITGTWFVTNGQQLQHSPYTESKLQCSKSQIVELVNYTAMINGNPKEANSKDIQELQKACSRKRSCRKPRKNNPNWGWDVLFKCIDPPSVSNEGSTEKSAASADELGDDEPNALVVAVPVLAVLLLVAACIIGFLLYRRSRSVKKDRNDSFTGKTLSDITNISAVAKDVCDDSSLDTSQRVSVLNEYSTIQDITAAASVPPTTDEGYYTIKDKEKNEYNLLSLNAPQIPNDPSYGHITEGGSDGLGNTYNHTNNLEHVLKDVFFRPKLQVPVNGSKPNVENKLQELATSTQDNISLNTESIKTGVDGYCHFGKIVEGNPGPHNQGTPTKKQAETDEADIDDLTRGYFVLEPPNSNTATDDKMSTPSAQYFVLEKTDAFDSRESSSEQTAQETSEANDEKPKKELDAQEINAESEYFETQINEQNSDQSLDYTSLDNPINPIIASNDTSVATIKNETVEKVMRK